MVKAVTKNAPQDVSYVSPAYILDVGAKLNGFQALPFIMLFFNYGLGCVIFDGYDEKSSIKGHKHKKR